MNKKKSAQSVKIEDLRRFIRCWDVPVPQGTPDPKSLHAKRVCKTDHLIAPIKMVPPEACDLKLNHRIPTPTVQIDALSSRSRGHSEALRNKIGMTFGIRLEMAERTLHVTTQLALCQTINPLHQW